MPETGKRTTVLLDVDDTNDLLYLAAKWKTSQMEVIRRSIRQTAEQESFKEARDGRK